jgi:hypothetical protein
VVISCPERAPEAEEKPAPKKRTHGARTRKPKKKPKVVADRTAL